MRQSMERSAAQKARPVVDLGVQIGVRLRQLDLKHLSAGSNNKQVKRYLNSRSSADLLISAKALTNFERRIASRCSKRSHSLLV
jgi:hypothetical protein